MNPRLRIALAAAAITLTAAALALAGASGTARAGGAYPGVNGKIVFTAGGSICLRRIFVVNADGTGQTDVTPPYEHIRPHCDLANFEPAWSGDGSHIVFISTRCWSSDPMNPGPCSQNDVWQTDALGTGWTHLTPTATVGEYTPALKWDEARLCRRP